MAIENVFTESTERPRWKFYLGLILLAAIISAMVMFFYPKMQSFFGKGDIAEKPSVKEEKFWYETLPEPVKKQPYTINVVPPPKVGGTIQPKGGK